VGWFVGMGLNCGLLGFCWDSFCLDFVVFLFSLFLFRLALFLVVVGLMWRGFFWRCVMVCEVWFFEGGMFLLIFGGLYLGAAFWRWGVLVALIFFVNWDWLFFFYFFCVCCCVGRAFGGLCVVCMLYVCLVFVQWIVFLVVGLLGGFLGLVLRGFGFHGGVLFC